MPAPMNSNSDIQPDTDNENGSKAGLLDTGLKEDATPMIELFFPKAEPETDTGTRGGRTILKSGIDYNDEGDRVVQQQLKT